jgi:hypothetical protein
MKKDSGQDAKIKELEKKVEESANNEKKLQQSMTRSGPAIRDEYNHDFQRLGPRFAQGDGKCCLALHRQPVHVRWRG